MVEADAPSGGASGATVGPSRPGSRKATRLRSRAAGVILGVLLGIAVGVPLVYWVTQDPWASLCAASARDLPIVIPEWLLVDVEDENGGRLTGLARVEA